jgi:Rrf2 family protein
MLSEIAAREALPVSFLSKIFQKLVKHGLLTSRRGVQRGYTLAREPRAIALRAVFEAIEGPDLFTRCVFWHHRCGEENPCLAHAAWRAVRGEVLAAFERTTLQNVVDARPPAASPGLPLPAASRPKAPPPRPRRLAPA